MNFLGVEGYRAKQRTVTETRERIEAGVRALGFEVLGAPKLGIVAFSHPEAKVGALWSKLRERGWFTSATSQPPGLHLMLSPFHAEVADAYLADLAWALDQALAGAAPATAEARYS
jgi:glutamate/tyrosine decarboxylase-like PLP-dependent enzyme